jgi:hypothetical protein
MRRDYGDREASSFAYMDADGDGFVQPNEWDENFDILDEDSDGFVSEGEWNNNNFRLIDTDEDGIISRDEWQQGFDHLDRDEDGALSEGDFYTRSATDELSEDELSELLADNSVQMNTGYTNGIKHTGPGNAKDELVADEAFADEMGFEDDIGFEDEDFDGLSKVSRVLSNKSKGETRSKADVTESYENFKKTLPKRSLNKWNRYEGAYSKGQMNVERMEANRKKYKLRKPKAKKQAGGDTGGSYMSMNNIRQMALFLETIHSQVQEGEELEDWVEDKISHAHGILSDLFGYFGFGDGFEGDLEGGHGDLEGDSHPHVSINIHHHYDDEDDEG